ncbi:hypothetical protein H632_c249p1 [Helicosporidium sp. ATCC 50920]|nr:hypothetical protein H632_c249p1 [Helicosporidium sp. ATCC 50920]|eukprot:KDD76377.1 hypothetical protein H632_c249p1 [Helicosporidium sp. ATCC 50920]
MYQRRPSCPSLRAQSLAMRAWCGGSNLALAGAEEDDAGARSHGCLLPFAEDACSLQVYFNRYLFGARLRTRGGVAAMVAPLILPVGMAEVSVRVQPVALLTICDAYIRRNEKQKRVIGTLLGSVSEGVVEVKTAYAVPHNEQDDQVSVDEQHHQTMLNLHRRVSLRERVVGWFSSDGEVSGSDVLLHSFFCKTTDAPTLVLLKVDTTLGSGALSIRAYSSRVLQLEGEELAREFQEIPCEVKSTEAERVGLDLLTQEDAQVPGSCSQRQAAEPQGEGPTTNGPASEAAGAQLSQLSSADASAAALDESLAHLEASLEAAASYAEAVAAGKTPPVASVGRALAEVVASVPRLTPEDLEATMSAARGDVVLAHYFAGLVRAHIALADKLGTMQLPLM